MWIENDAFVGRTETRERVGLPCGRQEQLWKENLGETKLCPTRPGQREEEAEMEVDLTTMHRNLFTQFE